MPITAKALIDLADDFDWEEWSDELEDGLEQLYRDVLIVQAEREADDLGIEFDPDDPFVSETMTEYVGERIVQLEETTRQEVADLIRSTLADAEDLTTFDLGTAIYEAVSSKFEDYARYRADRIARTECLPGETRVDAAVVRAAHRRWYQGPIVEVGTRYGRQFTATANHPMLTRRGWMPAGLMQEGDELICHNRQQHHRAAGDPNVGAGPATISEIFDAVAAVGITKRTRGRHPDFHGDGRDGDVDVACANGALRIGQFAALTKPALHDVLAVTNQARARLCRRCERLLPVEKTLCVCGATQGKAGIRQTSRDRAVSDAKRIGDGMARFALAVASSNLGGRQMQRPRVALGGEAVLGRVGLRAKNTGRAHRVPGPTLGGADSGCSVLQACASDIETDRVMSVRVRDWSGHVFNLTTVDGYFAINHGMQTGNTSIAYNHGAVLGYRQAGVTEVEVSDGDGDEECAEADGQIWSIEDALDDPIAHPGCVRSFSPVVPDEEERDEDGAEGDADESDADLDSEE